MCMMCEGYTEEEMLAHWRELIEDDGSLLLSVDSLFPWSYSVGLRWNFDHPELIAAHPVGSKAADAVGHALEDVAGGRRLRVGDIYRTPCGGSAIVQPVHHKNLAGEWFQRWSQLAHVCGQRLVSLRALQLVLLCDCADCTSQPDLRRRVVPR